MKRRAVRLASRAVGYLRVSTEDQNLGPEAQRAALEHWCAANHVTLSAVYAEDVSGGAPLDRRPQLLAAIDALAVQEAAVLLVAKRDRLARDTLAAGMVEQLVERQGARVLSADGVGNGEGPEAQLLRGIVDLFAQYERALIRARTKSALAVKRRRGERVGKVPFGYRLAADGVHLEADADEQATLALVRRLRSERWTYRGITEKLNAQGVAARGERWHVTTVVRLLSRAA